jgi:hypothetical protein
VSEIIDRLMGHAMRPLPTTTEGWLIQISGDVQATREGQAVTNEKLGTLIDGAAKLDGRLDTMEAWREKVEDDVAKVPSMLDWQKGIDGEIRGIKLTVALVSTVIGMLTGVIGATIAVLTNLAGIFGGKHP